MQDLKYKKSNIDEFCGNPLIEILPIYEPNLKEFADSLKKNQPFGKAYRKAPQHERLLMTQRVMRFYQPLDIDIQTALAVDKCIRWGYTGRNPVSPKYVKDMNERYYSMGKKNLPNTYYPHTYGFSVTGVSGVGKTTALNAILARYPQVIFHKEYEEIPLRTNQVVWVKIDFPCDGSLKGLCLEFFNEIDRLTGKDYSERYRSKTLDNLMVYMANVAAKENLGLLVIDEIQHLCTAKTNASLKALNFLVSMVNQIGVPVITIGTPAANKILQQDFQQAKRMSGQGNMIYGAMMKDSGSWEIFMRSMWKYQYTSTYVEQTKELTDALYKETFGIPFLVTILFMLIQERAIINGTEYFTVEDIETTAKEKLKLTEPMREALKRGNEVDIKTYLEKVGLNDVYHTQSVIIEPYVEVGMDKEQESPAPKPIPKVSVIDQATQKLVDLGINYKEAKECVLLAQKGSCKTIKAETLAMKAAQLYFFKNQSAAENVSSPLDDIDSYEEAKESGMIDTEVGGEK